MKKLLYFSHGLSANGIETFLLNVLEKLNKNKYDITVIIAIDDGVEPLHEREVLNMGVRVLHAGDLDGIKKKIAYIKNVKRFLKENNYDIVHSHMDLLNGITLRLSKKAGIPVRICHAHTSKSQYTSSDNRSSILIMVQKVYRIIMRKMMVSSSTELLACSDVAGKYFYGDLPYKMIYNGIDLDKYEKIDDFDTGLYCKNFGADSDKKKIVSVGRISWEKNPYFAIKIMEELKKIRHDFQYVLVGTGEMEEEVKEKTKELKLDDTVVFTGVRTDVARILNCCDCFLMTSLFEGLPFSLVEAQAAGLKCAVSDVVTDTANIGLVTFMSLEKSVKEWAELLNHLLDSETPAIDKEKQKLFDISNTVENLEQIYNN